MLNVLMLNFLMLNVIRLSVLMLNVIRLSVLAQFLLLPLPLHFRNFFFLNQNKTFSKQQSTLIDGQTGSTLVEHLPLHLKVEGSKPAAPGTERENAKNIWGL
jgi:hypothetical protein